ncbi:MAG: sensor histidine kinase, partial [Geminicoccales bacterium]
SLGESPRAAIISERGEIIASTLPAWAGPTRHYTGVDFAPAQTVVARAIELRGDDTDHGNSYVLDYSGDSMASAHPIMIDGEFAGLVLFQADGVVDAHPVPVTFYLLRIVGGNVILFGVLTVPVIAAAVPISIFRARRISRRLERLSDAATAMARGDLSQRVDIAGEDEVAQVGQRFNEMVAQLEQADRSRKAFVSNISHELRTPVAILQGNLEQLIARHQLSHDDVPDARTLEAMHQETVTLARLIDDLFTLARIEEAVLEFEPAPVNLAACIRRAVDGIASLAWNQQRVSVESLVADGVPPILAEETRVQQILSNLLYNALRHTPEGGVIVVNAQLEGGQVAVTIADTGLG